MTKKLTEKEKTEKALNDISDIEDQINALVKKYNKIATKNNFSTRAGLAISDLCDYAEDEEEAQYDIIEDDESTTETRYSVEDSDGNIIKDGLTLEQAEAKLEEVVEEAQRNINYQKIADRNLNYGNSPPISIYSDASDSWFWFPSTC